MVGWGKADARTRVAQAAAGPLTRASYLSISQSLGPPRSKWTTGRDKLTFAVGAFFFREFKGLRTYITIFLSFV